MIAHNTEELKKRHQSQDKWISFAPCERKKWLIFFFKNEEVSIARPKHIKKPGRSDRININQRIRAREVRVIDPDGNQLGVIPTHKALATAADFGLDLVEVSPTANPPVCKIMDYGRYKYELTKRQQEAKKKQSSFQIKEIKVRPKTGDHDLQVKIGHIKRFIENKDKVKVTVIFRGREITLSQLGRDLLKKIAEETDEFAAVEQMPKFEGRTMVMILSPK
ncbi:translation initiation factor IF-3 [Desulfonema magnum]|uniref:translation initiation factor IF-3 n=1 Tax=Desulfonema magnum TaxID=45655 RepID=UPI001A9C0730|nr:translation initiation factor IF-3 [Desulfonema magnum]